jgi:hypothetical protein
MQREKLDRLAKREDARAAHEGDIVIVDDIDSSIQNLSNTPRFENGETRLMARQRRNNPPVAFQPMDSDVGMLAVADLRGSRGQKVSVDTMDDFDLVASTGESVGETMHENAITAKIVWRIEGCNHAEAQRLFHHRLSGPQ